MGPDEFWINENTKSHKNSEQSTQLFTYGYITYASINLCLFTDFWCKSK